MIKKILLSIVIISLSGCNTLRSVGLMENIKTSYPLDACLMLKENPDWKESLQRSHKKWKTPISIQLAIIKQESNFMYKARPINYNRKWFWENKYLSSAYGFAQAIDGTWNDYLRETKNYNAKRTRFSDAVDFVGWYTNKSNTYLSIPLTNSRHLYYSYHEGYG